MISNDKELLISHLFDAPVENVFLAWTDPEQLKHWYAPDGCTIDFKAIDVREGGKFHYCISTPEYGDCWVTGAYLEVRQNEKLVFTMVMSNESGDAVSSVEAGKVEDWPESQIATVTFQPVGRQTKMTIHQTVSEEQAKETGAYQGWVNMFHKLNQFLLTNS